MKRRRLLFESVTTYDEEFHTATEEGKLNVAAVVATSPEQQNKREGLPATVETQPVEMTIERMRLFFELGSMYVSATMTLPAASSTPTPKG